MSSKIFTSVPFKRPGRNVFDLSHELKTSCNAGDLIPFLCQDVLPGDRFRTNSEVFIRFAPLISPVMHQVDCYTYYFFVPNRLLWSSWETFITGGETGEDDIDVVPPMIDYSTLTNDSDKPLVSSGSLADYFGMPVMDTLVESDGTQGTFFGVASSFPKVSALPFYAYAQIWNDYFRDQNFNNTEIEFNKDLDGVLPNTAARLVMSVKRKAWKKDYFTSALPWAQRGPDVGLPIGGRAPVNNPNPANLLNFWGPNGNPVNNTSGQSVVSSVGSDGNVHLNVGSDTPDHKVGNITGLSADLADATSVSINELRKQIALQRWYEANARGGSRYIEQIFSHFGVRSSDARLQRSEYLGGGKTPVVISDVPQTSASSGTSPQGNLAGKAMSYGNQNGFTRRFEEHGWIIGLMCVMPKAEYMQGLPRKFTRETKFDYAWPEFGHLGEQEILKQELFFNFMDSESMKYNTSTFGYTPRYAEYKYVPDYATGEFRKVGLSSWHWPRVFTPTNPPVLSQQFVTANPSSSIFAVDDSMAGVDEVTHKLWIDVNHHIKAVRSLPKYGVPIL